MACSSRYYRLGVNTWQSALADIKKIKQFLQSWSAKADHYVTANSHDYIFNTNRRTPLFNFNHPQLDGQL